MYIDCSNNKVLVRLQFANLATDHVHNLVSPSPLTHIQFLLIQGKAVPSSAFKRV